MAELKLSKQEQKMIVAIRASGEAKEEFRLTVSFEEGRWGVLLSTWPHGGKNKGQGQGETFDEAWENLSPLFRQ